MFSTYLANKLLDHALRNTSYTPAATVYAALFIGDPEVAGTEATGGSYARVSITYGSAAATKAIANTGAINFTTASANWGVITHAAIYDASSGGNRLTSGALAASRNVLNGDTFSFAIGALVNTLV
jgi:hypothetical protein